MRGLNVFVQDLKKMLQNRTSLITMVVVACLPVLYSGVMIKGSWDPYGQLDQLPVAIVNLDTGAEFAGSELHIGKDVVEELKTNGSFKWSFVSEEQAQEGITGNEYYMTVTIPADFSQKATTLMDDQPEQAEITYEPNWNYNYVGGQIGSNAVKEIKSSISAQITESYARSLFDHIKEISAGLGQAGSGAEQLNNGADKLESGARMLKTNIGKLAEGTQQVENGVKPLEQGAEKLHSGAASLFAGAGNLTDGLKQLSSAEGQLEAGAESANAGAGQLTGGLQTSTAGSKALVTGLEASVEGAVRLVSGLNASATSSSKVADGAKQVAEGLEQLAGANAQLAQNPLIQQLLEASRKVAEGSQALSAVQAQLLTGSESLAAGQQQLLAGGRKLAQGQQELLHGAEQLAAGNSRLAGGVKQFGSRLDLAAAGSKELAAGAGRLSTGITELRHGLAQLSGGAAKLASGSQQLSSGAGQLQSGAGQLAGGLDELAGKLNDAQGQTSSVKNNDVTVSMFADPVKLTENTDRKVEVYGLGIAPYFLSMALFVGGLVLTVVIPARTSTVTGSQPFGRFLSRTLTFMMMSVAQSLIAALILLYGIGINVQSVPLFLLFTFFTSLTFLMIIQTIVTWLDMPGRFVVIILLILQLTSSAGTFPRELLPEWMQRLNPYLPMTHSIRGLKAVISSGDYSLMWHQAGILLCYAAGFVLLTLLYFLRQNGNPIEKGKGAGAEF
ncbi:hypothetical protein PAECIP111892_00744 [Paenibacillus auburnensis]|uniref:ABC-2 type transporter transmembrane domain-containing protein n=1 Tax=Paenibacillus auburnensis TaxID=2905649 RepID=A0ABN8FWS1_9BACL|nr:YhgE/Pip domain-containing protein [Paenibacillus auburnensis]CAH1191785.1 hypothetical protein PAECIP111892_00744 [Paenibacillus auburnensis]